MAQVSKYPISKEIADRIFEIFTRSLIKVETSRDTQDLIEDLFTPTEKVMLAKRLAIAFLLFKEYQYREISKLLRVSLPTIASVNLSIKYGQGGYKRILKEILREEKTEEVFKGILQNLMAAHSRVRKGGSAYRYLKEEIEKSRKKAF